MSEGMTELKAMEAAYSALQPLKPCAQRRAAQWLLSALGLLDIQDAPENPAPTRVSAPENQDHNGNAPEVAEGSQSTQDVHETRNAHGAQGTNLTPKQFVSQKKPQTVAERIACLAFYLTHYREVPTFGPAEIEALNTDAACTSINRSRDIDNARRRGYLVPAIDGKKQISAMCEDFVNALPDRAAVKAMRAENSAPKKRRPSGGSKKRDTANGDDE